MGPPDSLSYGPPILLLPGVTAGVHMGWAVGEDVWKL